MKSTYFRPVVRSATFLDQSSRFYKSPRVQKLKVKHDNVESVKAITSHPATTPVNEHLEKQLGELYNLPQEELGAKLPQLKQYKKELELAVALYDRKINRTLLMEPPLRIALSVYLDIPLQDLSEKNVADAELKTLEWKKIVKFSESNDFRVLLLQGKLSKEDLEQVVRSDSISPSNH
jgi:hypothetical protein